MKCIKINSKKNKYLTHSKKKLKSTSILKTIVLTTCTFDYKRNIQQVNKDRQLFFIILLKKLPNFTMCSEILPMITGLYVSMLSFKIFCFSVQ